MRIATPWLKYLQLLTICVLLLAAAGCARSGDPSSGRGGSPPAGDTPAFPADMDSARRMLSAGSAGDAYTLLKQNREKLMAREAQRLTYLELFLEAAHATGQYEDFVLPSASMDWFDYRDERYYSERTQLTLKAMLESEAPMARWAAYRIGLLSAKTVARASGAFNLVMHDPDPFVRHRAMFLVDRFFPPKVVEALLPTLELLAAEDPEPMNQAFAAQLVRQYRLDVAAQAAE